MNTKVLQKCVEELNKEQPNLSYIKGMLETVIEMSNSQPVYQPSMPMVSNVLPPLPSLASIPVEEEGSGLLAVYNAGLPAELH